MLDALGTIIDAIGKFFDFLFSLVSDLFNFVSLATEAVKIPYYFSDYLPGLLGVSMVGVTAFAILKVLIGR